MPSSVRAPRRRVVLSLIAGLVLATIAAGPALANDPAVSGPDTPVTSGPGMPVTVDDGATPAVPDDTITGEQPTAWDHVVISPDGRTLTVYFYNGADGCYGLKDVEVSVTDGVPTITVWTGMRQDAIARICIEIAQLYKTKVVLDAPLLGGGAA